VEEGDGGDWPILALVIVSVLGGGVEGVDARRLEHGGENRRGVGIIAVGTVSL